MTDPSSWQAYGAYGSGYDSQADTSRRGSEQAGGNNGYAYESADSASMPGVPATSPETAYSFSINQQSSRGPAGDGAFGGDFYQVHSIASPVPSTGYAAPTSPQDWPGVSGRAPSGWPTAIAPYQYTLPGSESVHFHQAHNRVEQRQSGYPAYPTITQDEQPTDPLARHRTRNRYRRNRPSHPPNPDSGQPTNPADIQPNIPGILLPPDSQGFGIGRESSASVPGSSPLYNSDYMAATPSAETSDATGYQIPRTNSVSYASQQSTEGQGTSEYTVQCECGWTLRGTHASGNLKRHRRSQHCTSSQEKRQHVCLECGKVFQRSDALLNHKRKKHGVAPSQPRNSSTANS